LSSTIFCYGRLSRITLIVDWIGRSSEGLRGGEELVGSIDSLRFFFFFIGFSLWILGNSVLIMFVLGILGIGVNLSLDFSNIFTDDCKV
jgi:hypothetical protein